MSPQHTPGPWTVKLSVLEWAQERLDNSVRIAAGCEPADRAGWLEDVAYWREIVLRLSAMEGVFHD